MNFAQYTQAMFALGYALFLGGSFAWSHTHHPMFVSVTASNDTTCSLTQDGKMLCWGQGDSDTGKRGAGEPTSNSYTSSQVVGIEQLVAADNGLRHSCGISGDGSAWCWGRGESGQRGDGRNDQDLTYSPQPVYGLVGVTSISVGWNVSCAIDAGGSAWCWGNGYWGQRGDRTRTKIQSIPAKVSRVEDATKVAVGNIHACAIAKDQQVWCWGRNDYGQIGDGSWDNLREVRGEIPEEVDVVTEVVDIALGAHHSCAATKYGESYCWGKGDEGQLGNGALDQKVTQARKVEGLSGVQSLAAGFSHSCALTDSHEVWCWGKNRFGQLGIGSRDEEVFALPVKVEGLPPVIALAAGDRHTCAVSTSGQMWCWGKNSSWQLGSGEAKEHAFKPRLVVLSD